MIKVHHQISRSANKVVIVSLVIIAILLIFSVRNSSGLGAIILMTATVIYLAWALIFHHLDKSLTLETFLEYVLTALLAVVLLIGFLI